jgi:hypothetical protein
MPWQGWDMCSTTQEEKKALEAEKLKEHIERYGKEWFRRSRGMSCAALKDYGQARF